jgi:hypothetical protein
VFLPVEVAAATARHVPVASSPGQPPPAARLREKDQPRCGDSHLKPELKGQVQSLLQLLRELEREHCGRLGGCGCHRDEEEEGPQEERNREPT